MKLKKAFKKSNTFVLKIHCGQNTCLSVTDSYQTFHARNFKRHFVDKIKLLKLLLIQVHISMILKSPNSMYKCENISAVVHFGLLICTYLF